MSGSYRFATFVLSPRQRLLVRAGQPVPLIPKYFDLLLLLIRRRHEAVSKDDIFAAVWQDVVVSDGALSQAVRTIRRALGDHPRQPIFIRTVSRHGYQFVWPDVAEEATDVVATEASAPAVAVEAPEIATLVEALIASPPEAVDDAGDLAEQLHELGTVAALRALAGRPGHAVAVAQLREARWNVAGAGAVPLVGDPELVPTLVALVRLRIGAARHAMASRWTGAATCGAVGGALAGAVGGTLLAFAPTSTADVRAVLALVVIGAAAGALGAAGIGAGLAAAEVLARARRGLALAVCGAAAGALTAGGASIVAQALLETLFGVRLDPGGALEGLVLGTASGLGYALATPQPPGGGMAAPSGRRRWRVALIVGGVCAVAAAGLGASGHLLVGGVVHEVARVSRDAPLVLAPLGRLIGEPGFGPLTRTLLSAFEGGVFGGALAWGLTRRPGRI